MSLSVIIPARNEVATIAQQIARVRSAFPAAEVLVVDNASSDGTCAEALRAGASCIMCPTPGKGAAMMLGVQAARGDIVLFHDADGEYEIADTPALVTAAASCTMAVGCRNPSDMKWSSVRANAFVRRLLSARFGIAPADILSGSRALMKADLLSLAPGSQGFGIETELTARCLAEGFRVVESPVRYTPRDKEDGKKIRAYHLLVCAWAAVRPCGDGIRQPVPVILP